METEKKILIGTSGWGYDEWVGKFYPKSLGREDYLSYYSKVFYTNEINTTFYQIPSIWIVKNWVKKTPRNFVFSAKLPQTITHEHKLDINGCADDLDFYLKSMDPLIKNNKLWAFLIQLPPSFTKDLHFNNLKTFIENWPQDYPNRKYHLVVEFRDKSWMDDKVFSYLKENSLTYCAVVEPLLPPRMDVTNPEFVYIRFHGYGTKIWFDYFFEKEEIKKWSLPVKEVISKSKNVGIYFNNHFSGYAAKDALMMMKELNYKPRTKPKEISLFEVKKESGTYKKGQTSLDKFMK
jgi:uncharacterized protein YecE (DUF72 family)